MSEEDKKGLILLDLGGTLTSIPYSDQGPFLDTIKADYKAVILTTSIEEAKIYFDELAK